MTAHLLTTANLTRHQKLLAGFGYFLIIVIDNMQSLVKSYTRICISFRFKGLENIVKGIL